MKEVDYDDLVPIEGVIRRIWFTWWFAKTRLDNSVYDLIDGEKKDYQVVFDLISKDNPKGATTSDDDVFYDTYQTGVFDITDLRGLEGNHGSTKYIADNGLYA